MSCFWGVRYMKLARRRFLYLATGAAAFPAFPSTAGAQVFPTRAVRLIVPLSAGSAADILARLLATKMSESWGQPVVVENRSGAGTTIGTNAVAKAAPDGHTLLVNSAAFAASAAIYAKLAYDPLKDFAPVSQLAIAPIVVVAAPSLGVGSIKELVELAKRKPGQLKFGSSGVGSSTHFAGEQFKLAAGLSVVHVAYKGSPEAALDTMTGRIEYCLSPVLPALPFIRDGKLLALAVTTAQRSPLLQDVPTVAEAGVPNYEYQDWWGVFAPAATPVAVIDKIGKEIARVFELSDVKQQALNQGAEARPSPPADFAKFVRAKVETARQAAASANIRAH
jgi:tripartite-type tricarboxylate transporter receptor subunit TctC